jgi:sugar transferase EpsL
VADLSCFGVASKRKRILDIVLAFGILVLTLPLSAIAALAIGMSMGSPVLFRQQRIGHGGRRFTLLKFRTMRRLEGLPSDSRADASRLTRLGALLRRTSIDELPQIVNVLKGEMSLVGPRPLLVEYVPLYSSFQWRRHEAKPGITGWTQVNGRNALAWRQKFELDVWYVDNWSMTLDLKILLLTFRQIFLGAGVSAEGHATMPRFDGNDNGDVPSDTA